MYKKSVIRHFGSVHGVIEALKAHGYSITRQGIHIWQDVIPLDRAFQIEQASDGALKIDLETYRKFYVEKDKVA
jgi:hypothetical protein